MSATQTYEDYLRGQVERGQYGVAIIQAQIALDIAEYIEKHRQPTIEPEPIWHDPATDLPPDDQFVLGLLTGIVGGIRCEHAPFIINWLDDGLGWLLVNESEKPGDNWQVNAWMPIPEWGERE